MLQCDSPAAAPGAVADVGALSWVTVWVLKPADTSAGGGGGRASRRDGTRRGGCALTRAVSERLGLALPLMKT